MVHWAAGKRKAAPGVLHNVWSDQKVERMEDAAKILASELAAQLPVDFVEAGKVINYLNELRHWRAGKPLPEPIHSVVTPFRREGVGGAAGNSPSR